MKHSFNKDRSHLIIEVTPAEQMELREAQSMRDFLEPLTCNSDLDWIMPEWTGDLTSAPILGIVSGEAAEPVVSERWGFEPYQVRSPLEDLRDTGRAVFSNHW